MPPTSAAASPPLSSGRPLATPSLGSTITAITAAKPTGVRMANSFDQPGRRLPIRSVRIRVIDGERLFIAGTGAARDLRFVESAGGFQPLKLVCARLALPAYQQGFAARANQFADREIGEQQGDAAGDQRQRQRAVGDRSRADRRAGCLGADAGSDADDIIGRQCHALTGDRGRHGTRKRRQPGNDRRRQQHRGYQRHRRRRPEEQRNDVGHGGKNEKCSVTIRHHRPERLHHQHVGAQRLQRVQQRCDQGDHEEDVEQLLGGDKACVEDASKRAYRTVCPDQRNGEGGDDRRHHHVGAQDHCQHDGHHACEIDPVGRGNCDLLTHSSPGWNRLVNPLLRIVYCIPSAQALI